MKRLLLLFLLMLAAAPASAQTFDAFTESVLATPATGQQARVDSFLTAAPTVPYFDSDTVAVFLWSGSATSMAVAGDFNSWNANAWPMTRLGSTTLWYRTETFPSDARLDYKLVRNGSSWILDPRNPLRVSGGFGPNSELAMPAYVQPPEIVPDPTVPRGTLTSHTFASTGMGNSRRVQVYVPASYDASVPPYPVVVYHDGGEYVSLASMPTILDNLIALESVAPVVVVFVDPVNREQEYWTTRSAAFVDMVVTELMPWVRANWNVTDEPGRTAVTGASLGGLISTRLCFEHPEVFGLCGPFSPSWWVDDQALINDVIAQPVPGQRWYLDWGTYEGSISRITPAALNAMQAAGMDAVGNAWNEGHSWGSWRAHQDEMLAWFFRPASVGTEVRERPDVPLEGTLAIHPNPVAAYATVTVSLASSGRLALTLHDALGRNVRTFPARHLGPGTDTFAVDLSGLAGGSYFLVAELPGGTTTTRPLTILR
ncbi:MAG: alpha/beta hydrolase-fold protein [Rhodothermales bacterium]